MLFPSNGHWSGLEVKREAKSEVVSRDGNERKGRKGGSGFVMTLKIMAEQAIKMKRGGGKGKGCRIHANVSRKGKEEVALRGEKDGEDGEQPQHTYKRHSWSH